MRRRLHERHVERGLRLFRRHGMKVATVSSDDHVVLKNIQIGRDFGTRVEVVSGLAPTDRIIDSPPDWIAEGDQVHPGEPVAALKPKVAPAVAVAP